MCFVKLVDRNLLPTGTRFIDHVKRKLEYFVVVVVAVVVVVLP